MMLGQSLKVLGHGKQLRPSGGILDRCRQATAFLGHCLQLIAS
jgi:hypothetical protein